MRNRPALAERRLAVIAVSETDAVANTTARDCTRAAVHEMVAPSALSVSFHAGAGLRATFGEVGEAVVAAMRVLRSIERRRAWGEQLTRVAIGLAVGHVVCEHDDVYGGAFAEAVRLADAASGGTALATRDIVEAVAACRRLLVSSIGPAESMQLKGLPRHFDVYAVTPLPAAQSMDIRDPSSAHLPGSVLSHVAPELASGDVRTVGADFVAIAGEPGAGGSYLLAWLRTEARARGEMALAADAAADAPLNDLVADELHARVPADELADMSRFAPRDRPGQPDPVQGLVCELAHVGAIRDVLLTIDGADAMTSADTELVAALAVDTPATIVTHRSGPVLGSTPFDRVLSEVFRRRRAKTLALRPLDAAALSKLVEYWSGYTISEAAASLLHEACGGNAGLARALLADGWLRHCAHGSVHVAGRATAAALEARLHELDPGVKRLLCAAARRGEPFEAYHLTADVGADRRTVLHSLADCVDARLLREVDDTDAFAFVHGALRDYLAVFTGR